MILVWPTMMLATETIQERAKTVIKNFISMYMPALKVCAGIKNYMKSVTYIE
jgi:hypothetical protein